MHTLYKRIADQLSTLADSYIGDPPDAVDIPYTFVWGPYPTKQSSTLAGVQGEVDFVAHVTVVAHSPANALSLAAQVEALLAGWEPVVPGWRVFPIRVYGSEPVQTSRGIFDAESNRFPAWVVVHLNIMAVKVRQEGLNDG